MKISRKGFTGWGAAWRNPVSDISETEGSSIRSALPVSDGSSNANIQFSGSIVKVTFQAASSGNFIVDHASIVERTTNADGAATPTELLFNGASGFSISNGASITSDPLTFTLDKTKEYIIIFDINSVAGSGKTVTSGTGFGAAYYKAATASYSTQTVTGFLQASPPRMFGVSKIEVKPFANEVGGPQGGTVTFDGVYKIHTFLSSGTFTAPNGITAEVLVVGGGGTGFQTQDNADAGCGGGGGGGVIDQNNFVISAGSHTVTVAGAKLAPVGDARSSYSGDSSTFMSLTASGGGGGYVYRGYGYSTDPTGGSSGSPTVFVGGNMSGYTGGGGGGAGSAGNSSGDGGNGLSSSISGSLVCYGGGGGGGYTGTPTTGGFGGGGGGAAGGPTGQPPTMAGSGEVNTGGGGGGTYGASTYNGQAGNGGSGIVIIRYLATE